MVSLMRAETNVKPIDKLATSKTTDRYILLGTEGKRTVPAKTMRKAFTRHSP